MQVFMEHETTLRGAEHMCWAIGHHNKIAFICYCSIRNNLIDLYQIWLHGKRGFFCRNRVSGSWTKKMNSIS